MDMFLYILPLLALIPLSTWAVRKWCKNIERWADISTIIGGGATAFSVVFAVVLYFGSVDVQRKVAAADLYNEHMHLSMEFPEFTDEKLLPANVRDSSDRILYTKYRWYMGHAFYTFESVLDVESNSNEWETTIAAFVKDHPNYICTNSIKLKRFTKELQNLVNKIKEQNCPCSPAGKK